MSVSSSARDACGEGQATFYQVPSKTIWKRFPIKVFIDESRYPGSETKLAARAAIKRVIDQTNTELGFSFYSIRLDKSLCNLSIQFGELSSGIGVSHYRYRSSGSGYETYESTVTLNTNTNWFINPMEQCYASGSRVHMPAVIAHELGHSIGLDHNPNDILATMKPKTPVGQTLGETYGLSERTFMHKLYDRFKPAGPSFTCTVKSTTSGIRWQCSNATSTWFAGPDYRYNGLLASEAV